MKCEEKFGSQSTPRATQTQRRAMQGRRPPERRPLRSHNSESTRQCCRTEFTVSHSKQRTGAPATRQFLTDCFGTIFVFPFSNFDDSTTIAVPSECSEPRGRCPKKGVNQNQVFANATRSKQTSGAPKGCQFFAMCFCSCSASVSLAVFGSLARGKRRRDASATKNYCNEKARRTLPGMPLPVPT